ncbi:MAG: thioredoxin family protein [Chitinophagales bacterium]|nr:thioredoxin family protein [Chitinophagales bacterium]
MIKRLVLSSFALLLYSATFAQIFDPVKWSWKATETAKGEYSLVFTAKIDAKWHVYSQNIGEGGPVPTSFQFEKNSNVELVGKTTETGVKVHDGHDPVFDMQLKYYETGMTCTQKVKVKADTKLKGTVEFMVCDDERCLPPTVVDFEFDLKGGAAIAPATKDSTTKGSIDTQKIFDSTVQAVIDAEVKKDVAHNSGCDYGKDGFDATQFGEPQKDCGKQINTVSLWDAITEGFIWGLLAIFMPCVFPMIPLTVSFFTKRSESAAKGKTAAFFYAGSIIFIYFLFSLPFVLLGSSQDSLNNFSTNPVVNMVFFVVFVVFAFSFFGFYDISLPSSIVNRSDSASNAAGYVGIFFMALTLVLVSFSCTGPLLGNLIGNAYSSPGGKLKLMVGFTSFGTALALPFALFSLFPELLKKLPKSGGWMNTFKVTLGFVELILAIKFLANADNVSHWGFMKREVFLGLWAVLGFALFLYLIGVFQFTKEHNDGKISWGRYGFSILVLAFAVYSGYGMYCNDVPLFSGFPPPQTKEFSWCVDCKNDCPQNLNCYHDYCAAMEAAKRENKPVLLDFTGYACQNCRKMEENVWSQPEVHELLSNKYIVLSLYVDDRQKLPESEQYFSKTLNKKVTTVGTKWSDLEQTCFNNNTQPLYAIISPEGKLINDPRGYTPEVEVYRDWLRCGAGK